MYNILLKKKILFCLILSLLLLIASVVYVSVNVRVFQSRIPADAAINSQLYIEKSDEPPVYECCTPLNSSLRKNLFFLKTHKTASSTVQNVILRFAINNSLDVMGTFYEAYFLPFTDLSILPQMKTSNGKYHIFTNHLVYNYEKLKRYQYPNTPMVTIMRHPARLFQSVYEYFQINNSIGMTFEQFLHAPVKPPLPLVPIPNVNMWFGYNWMSYDLGFDLFKNVKNQNAIEEFIIKLDREFDFVMITEHLEASLILLANLMGWPLEYLVHLPINSTPRDPNNTYTLTSRDKLILMDLNPIDTQLYHHFLKKFLKCVEQYGEEKLQQQVIQLKRMNDELRERCVANVTKGTFLNAVSVEYVSKNDSDLECKYVLMNEIEIESAAFIEQFKRLYLT